MLGYDGRMLLDFGQRFIIFDAAGELFSPHNPHEINLGATKQHLLKQVLSPKGASFCSRGIHPLRIRQQHLLGRIHL